MPKVTIIIPVYNSEEYIANCLESILNQTNQDYEILVINDGSSDGSQQIIDEYKDRYPDKIISVNQKNKGVSQTRNEGIENANGKYIMFVDNDDYLDKEYVETFLSSIEENDYDIVLGGYRRITETGKILKQISLKNEEWSKFMIPAPWAKIYKREFLLKNKITFLKNNIGEDIFFNIKAMLITDNIKILDYVGYNWFFNTKSVSNTIQKNITNLQVYELLNACYDELKENDLIEKKYDIIKTFFTRYIVWVLSFSTKKLSKDIIYEEYDKLFKWLNDRFPDYKTNKMIGFFKPKGEILSVRVFTKLFYIAHKVNLAKFIVYCYSKI